MPDITLGLRERRKIKTKSSIQREALRLFLDKGYQATSIEDIAEAVEIAPSTFFAYFPSKVDVLLQDEFDPVLIAAFNSQPSHLTPIAALRGAMHSVLTGLTAEQLDSFRERTALIARDAALRSAILNKFAGLRDEVSQVIARRVGRSATDFAVRNVAGALLGVLMSGLDVVADDPDPDLIALLDAGLGHLEAGLPID